MAVPFPGDPCLYNDGTRLRPAQWLSYDRINDEGTIRIFKINPDIDTARGPDPDGGWSPDPTPAAFAPVDPTLPSGSGGLQTGEAGYTYEGYLYDLAQKTDIIFPLTGYVGAAWAPGPTPLEQGGPLRTTIISQKVLLGQIQTTRDQVRTTMLWQVKDRVGSPMTLEVWNTTTSTLLASTMTNGLGLNDDYQVDFATPSPGPQIGEFVYSAIAISGAVASVGFFEVYGARLLEVRP